MILDATKVELIPGQNGKYCKGNGTHKNDLGSLIECCCDECDYYFCCFGNHTKEECNRCSDSKCPHANKNGDNSFFKRLRY